MVAPLLICSLYNRSSRLVIVYCSLILYTILINAISFELNQNSTMSAGVDQ